MNARAESWDVEWGTPDGGGFVRLALRPEDRVAWFWAYLLRPGRGPVVVRDHEVALPRGPLLEIRADALWAELVCETPHEHWGIGLEAFGVALDDPADALAGEIGERVALGFDLEWETVGEPARTATAADDADGEEQPGRVRGEVLLGRERLAIDTPGRFAHRCGSAAAMPDAPRRTVAFDDGSWWSRTGAGADATVVTWDAGGSVSPPLAGSSPEPALTVVATADIPIGAEVATRGLGAATLAGRVGTGWMASIARTCAKIG